MPRIPWTAAQAAAAGRNQHNDDELTTRAEIEEALARAVHAARRTFRVVGTPEAPTKWDTCHQYIGYLLYQWQTTPE